MRNRFFCLSVFFVIVLSASAQNVQPPFLTYRNNHWVDSVFNSLTTDERIAQLIVAAAFSNRGPEHADEIRKLITEQKIGGLIFLQGGPVREAALINDYQAISKVPLLIAMDAEWGLGMRLDSTISFPYQMTLGAIRDNALIYQMGVDVARQMKRAGIHTNFAPVMDVNNNPANPVINFRSFGENKLNVTQKGIAYMKGMQDNNILTTAKHFPGHGDTGTDSHYALPVINHPRERLDSLELYPFREIIRAGVGGIMVAHLNIPALDTSKSPSTLSRKIITDLLKKELGFEGVVVTDAMNMKGVTASNPPGVVDKDAILAGNDVLEFTENVPRAIEEIRKAIRQGLITQKEIDDRCRKMLAVKYWVGLNKFKPILLKGMNKDLNTPEAKLLNRKLTEASLTVLNNGGDVVPLQRLDTLRIASVAFGVEKETVFQRTLSLYTEVKHFILPKTATSKQVNIVKEQLKDYNLVIGSVHDDAGRPWNRLTLPDTILTFVSELAAKPNVIFSVFKNPYVLDKIKDIEKARALIMTYQDNSNAEELTAQLIFGGIGASGQLPVTIGSKYGAGHGLEVKGGIRFKYTLPEDAGMSSDILYRKVDSLVNQALLVKAIPGCQVLIAKDRKIVMHKAYGLQDHSDTIKVKLTDLYDLASVTKISTGLPSLMKLYDEKKFDVDKPLGFYLKDFKRSNKGDISMRDILTHQARFAPWIPFWKNTIRKNGSYRWRTIKSDSSSRYPIKLKDDMFLHRKYPDKIVKAIRKSPLSKEKKYVYSDFFFILAPRVVESMIDEDFTSYLQKNFYSPLGASSVMYNPNRKYPKNAIVPTEHDFGFRREAIHGTVHDEGAIMMGGVSGHAGLFANANDLAKLMQMYLDRGEYGGQRYISAETMTEFSRTQFPDNNNRRALGFDKPNLVYSGVNNNTAKDASAESFGHTGFTGTFAWMDPKSGLLYIFLSNRVNPTRNNTRLYQLNTRTAIQQAMYDALKK
ncbi:MAG TPA: glycoside hydrolase family 3 N-terminal domain-containing protein [Chryseosolibacter sp.]|nr:glycoside hydrolase family 3 N-terminal domain-containing protein [Chryseosolibacter sp.]